MGDHATFEPYSSQCCGNGSDNPEWHIIGIFWGSSSRLIIDKLPGSIHLKKAKGVPVATDAPELLDCVILHVAQHCIDIRNLSWQLAGSSMFD